MPIFALRPGDIDFVSPTHGLEDISFPSYSPQLPHIPFEEVFTGLADLRAFSVGSGNYLTTNIARYGGWISLENIESGHDYVGAFGIVATIAAASIPQTITKVIPYTNPYTAVPTAVLDIYNFHRYGFEYLWS